jgi:hypothetical protein
VRAELKLTVQLVSLADPDVIEGTKMGYTGALDNLARELQRAQPIA